MNNSDQATIPNTLINPATFPAESLPNEQIFPHQAQTHTEYVDVVIMFLPSQQKEFLQNIIVQTYQNGCIDFCDLLKSLKTMSFPVEKNMVSYYSYTNDMYVYCGCDPIPSGSYIPASDVVLYGDHKTVTIKIRQIQSAIPIEIKAESDVIGNEDDQEDAGEGTRPTRRTKERKIGDVVDKVLQWRRLYSGVIDPATGQTVKLSLDESATRVGIKKKTLDDYLLQIRFGKKFGFNFNDHYNDKVGVLRSFVKKFKGKDSKGKSPISEEIENCGEDDERKNESTLHKRTRRGK